MCDCAGEPPDMDEDVDEPAESDPDSDEVPTAET